MEHLPGTAGNFVERRTGLWEAAADVWLATVANKLCEGNCLTAQTPFHPPGERPESRRTVSKNRARGAVLERLLLLPSATTSQESQSPKAGLPMDREADRSLSRMRSKPGNESRFSAGKNVFSRTSYIVWSYGISLKLLAVAISRMAFAVCSSVSRTNVPGGTEKSEAFLGQQTSNNVAAAAHTSAANFTRTWEGFWGLPINYYIVRSRLAARVWQRHCLKGLQGSEKEL